jgi:hypothetical protein
MGRKAHVTELCILLLLVDLPADERSEVFAGIVEGMGATLHRVH